MCVVGEQGYEEQNLMNVLFIGPQKRQTLAAYFLAVKCTQVKGFSTCEPIHNTSDWRWAQSTFLKAFSILKTKISSLKIMTKKINS